MNRKKDLKKLKDYRRALYNIDMVQGFVNIGPMSNKEYNKLVPEQLKFLEDFKTSNDCINFIGEGHSENALEFESYPKHCVIGTEEAEFIKEFRNYLDLKNTRIYRKNSINGMFNDQLRKDILEMTNLDICVFVGVCEDLCVMDFVRTYARYLDEINRKVNLFVIEDAVDTFDSANHSRSEWKRIARMVMEQAGVIYVKDYAEFKEKEKVLMLGGK